MLTLSPHLDDAVLSCAATLAWHRARGARVVVATLFSSSSPNSTGERQAEDLRALRLLGCEPLWIGFPDAIERAGAMPFTDLFFSPPADHVVHEAAEAIERVATSLRPDLLLVPLGVGTHQDHLAVYEASLLARLPQLAVSYYEERPYVLVDGQFEYRAGQLGLNRPPTHPFSVASFLDALRTAPYAQRHFPHLDELPALILRIEQAVHAGSVLRRELLPVTLSYGSPGSDIAWSAQQCYASQKRVIAPTRAAFDMGEGGLAGRYGRSGSGRVERYWRTAANTAETMTTGP
ncbi:MAG: PIG-L deacetylase family protein [Gammaproteobacteria bacterium]